MSAQAADLMGSAGLQRGPGVAADESLASPLQDSAAGKDGWLSSIREIRLWWQHFGDWREEGVVPPSSPTLNLAIEMAQCMRIKGMAAPTKVLPDGEGGVLFEHRSGPLYETITLTKDHELEFDRYNSGRLVAAHRGSLDSLL